MEGFLHAAALVSVILSSAALCYRRGREPQRALRVLMMSLASLVALQVIFAPFLSHAFFEPEHSVLFWPTLLSRQWPVLGICLGLILYFVPMSHRNRVVTALIFLGLASLFSLHLARLDRFYIVEPFVPSSARCVSPTVPYWHTWLTGIWTQKISSWHPPVALFIGEFDTSPAPAQKFENELGTSLDAHQLFSRLLGTRGMTDVARHCLTNVIGICVIPLFTISILLLVRRRKGGEAAGLQIPYLFSLLVLFLAVVVPCWPSPGIVPKVWFIGLVCVALLGGWFIAQVKVLYIALLVVTLLAVGVSTHAYYLRNGFFGGKEVIYNYGALCHHQPPYTRGEVLQGVRDDLQPLVHRDTRSYPAGWLEDCPLWEKKDLHAGWRNEHVVTPRRAWHTSLTGLSYTRVYAPWYPGGRVCDAIDDIELRQLRP